MNAIADPTLPDTCVSARDTFGVATDLMVPAFSEPSQHVPMVDPVYRFDQEVTLALLAGFTYNRRVLIQGLHGTGKSSHIEQVAARLNWPCIRVNLDGQITRLELVGKDAVTIEDGKQVTTFRQGIVPWALQRPYALVLDEYDAGRPDVMFVLQQVLESEGRFTLLDREVVLTPHPWFRIFATSNTVGLGNLNGLYHGVQRLNHAQLDRWHLVASLNYLPAEEEVAIVQARVASLRNAAGTQLTRSMVELAALTRNGFLAGDISTLMSPRTVIMWAENAKIFSDVAAAFRLTFLNKCDESEQHIIAEYFQRCFDDELVEVAPPAAALV